MSKTKEWLMEVQEKDEYIAGEMTFEDYLKEMHGKGYNGLDDGMTDAFDNWLGELDGEEYIEYAEAFVALIRSKIEGLTPDYNPN